MKTKLARMIFLICVLALAVNGALAQGKGKGKGGGKGKAAKNAPTTILHIVTVKWTPASTPEQQQAAIDGVKVMAAEIPGILRTWTKKIKVQPADFSTLFVMEFKDQAALDAYVPHASHKKWEELYLPIRERSTTHDVSN